MIDLRRYTSHGLDDFGSFLQRFQQSCRVEFGTPPLAVHEDCLYVPGGKGRLQGHPYRGGLFDPRGAAIAEGSLLRHGRQVSHAEVEPAAARAGEALYLGWLFSPPAHALLESLSRAWALPQLGGLPLVFHAPVLESLPEFFVRLLKRLDVDPRRVVLPTQATRFERLHVPTPAFQVGSHAYRVQAETFRRMVDPGLDTDPRPLYVSRSGLPPGKRGAAGEAVLEEILAAQGWRVVQLGELSQGQQIAAFNRHATIVGEPDALHGVVFSRPGTRVLYLVDGLPHLNHLLCDELAQLRGCYLRCHDLHGRKPMGRASVYRLDLAAALDGLRAEGLLAQQPEGLAALQARVDEEHEARWAAASARQAAGAGAAAQA